MKKIFCFSVAIALLGCGSESADNTSNSAVPVGITAYNKLATASVNAPQSIDLTRNIEGQNAILSGVFSDKPEYCFAQVDGEMSISVELYQQGRCDYIFEAQNALGQTAQAKLTVVSSSDAEPVLPTIPFSAEVSSEVSPKIVVIDLTQKFGSDYLSGFSINQNPEQFIVQTQSGAEPITIISNDGLIIKFSTPTTIGWHNISYQLDKGSESKIGEIFITVTDKDFPAPTITQPNFIYTEKTGLLSASLDIDLSKSSCNDILAQDCLDIKSDNEWQLTDAQSYTGQASVKEQNNNVFNKTLSFMATENQAGKAHHDISYIVSNHHGASSMGMLRVFSAEKSVDFTGWNKIRYENKRYIHDDRLQSNARGGKITITEEWTLSAPLSHIQAINSPDENFNYHAEIEDSTTKLVSTWSKAQAEALCPESETNTSCLTRDDEYECREGLPTEDDLAMLIEKTESSEDDYHEEFNSWPKDRRYFILGTEPNAPKIQLYDLNTKQPYILPDGYQGYVSCVIYDFHEYEYDD